MARNRTAPAPTDTESGFIPDNVLGDEAFLHDGATTDPDPRDAEIEKLRAELEALRGAAPSVAGGKFTVSIKDGPTATVEAKVGETPQDAFFRCCGIHSTPHRPSVSVAAADAVCGIHYPNGTTIPFAK